MEDVKIILSALWVALMLTNLLGDVLRIFAGDFTAGEIEGAQMTPVMLLGIAILMLIPIVMVFLSLTLQYPVNRWVNIIAAIVLFGFNIFGLPTYPGAYARAHLEQFPKVVNHLKTKGIREKVKVIIGGAVVIEEFALEAEVDAYAKTAIKGVNICKKWAK